MAPLSLKIVKDDGAVTRKVKLDPDMKVWEVHGIVKEKFLMPDDVKDYGLFLRSPDNDLSGIWLEEQRTLNYYMLRNEDRLDYMSKIRNLRLRMLDGTVKTLQVDQSKTVGDLMIGICGRIGLTNHDEYGLCLDSDDEIEDGKENKGGQSGTLSRGGQSGTLNRSGQSGTLTLKKKSQLRDRDVQFEQLSKKLKTDDNVEWIDAHKTLSEACVDPRRTLLLKRRLFYSDRNVDSRDPVQLNLLYVQARDNILQAVHPIAEARAADCKVRWINIRDVHRRIIRKRLSGSDHPKRAYKYDEQLKFMTNFYKEINPLAGGSAESDTEVDKNESWHDVDYNEDSDEADAKPLKKCKTKSRTKTSFEEIELPAPLNESTDFDTTDPVDSFLISIGTTLKKFSPYHLNLAKSKIFQIVQEHDLQQIVEKQQGRDAGVVTSDNIYYQGEQSHSFKNIGNV